MSSWCVLYVILGFVISLMLAAGALILLRDDYRRYRRGRRIRDLGVALSGEDQRFLWRLWNEVENQKRDSRES